MDWTKHSWGNLIDRIVSNKLSNRREVESAIKEHGSFFKQETHIIVKRLPVEVQLNDGSNGDTVLAVVNGSTIVTLMLRRSEQIERPWERKRKVRRNRPPVLGG